MRRRKSLSVIRRVKLFGRKSISSDMPMDIGVCDEVNVLTRANGSGKSNFVSFLKETLINPSED